MYEINDTIAAISSASVGVGEVGKSIVRISGAETSTILKNIVSTNNEENRRHITTGKIRIGNTLEVDAVVYRFFAPHSYTGEDLAELHFFAAAPVVGCIFAEVVGQSRQAGAGEFTLRAYLNGKIDLSQAEAVAEIVAGSNKYQLAAAEKLLAGKLSLTVGDLRGDLLEIMSLIEAGMDFSEEGIEFVTRQKAAETISQIKGRLTELLDGSIHYEEMIDLSAVGLAGVANAGKSSLLNRLLGKDRSIVSGDEATTRDVLTGLLELDNCRCALFDCAGLAAEVGKTDVLGILSRGAAIEALKSAKLVLFCVDVTKNDYTQDVAIRKLVQAQEMILVATKCDLLPDERLSTKMTELKRSFATEPVATSTMTGRGINDLRIAIDSSLVAESGASAEADERIAINERHRRTVEEAIENLAQAEKEMNMGNDEVAAMLLRAGYRGLGGLEREHIDEEILERIFSSFCIGK